MNNYSDKIAILTGDPNGIGAEITIKALNLLNLPANDVIIISNSKIINKYGSLNNNYEIVEVEFNAKIEPGKVTADAGDFAFRCIQKACEIKPKFIVTAPTSKEAMFLAGHKFNGQTEVLEYFLARNGQKAEMLFVSKDFRVLLLTRHVALKDIKLTKSLLLEKVERLRNYFQNKLNINKPSFALCALNPHAGENGIIGDEESSIMLPAVRALRNRGVNITNPLPADTLFINGVQNYLANKKMPYDCYIACYHDQGLIPIKSIASEKTVNMTIGLDVIRTSPSHGTAFDIAGKNIANPDSMIEAIKACFV
ncbi:MAG: 4-hydroxythreonine-4-phosphate dehydrogenase [Cyanobacteria bacterium SIG31]|nr:4-hydroxythreonine-4-phosphate dehydrogenase [Cyanobacteria bacterium SIG31]